jgi:hypothetical protein
LGSQTSGTYNARISSATGKGEYVVHSGGGSKDRMYDMVGDREGNLYNIGYHMNLRTLWGNSLETVMRELDVDPAIAGSEAVETHMYVSKLAAQAASQVTPPCLTECTGTTDEAIVEANSCFIDGKCYAAGDTGDVFGKSCFVCDPSVSQRVWSEAPTLGSTQCFVDNMCVDEGDFLFYQRRTWSAKIFSSCQVCSPEKDAMAWSLTNSDEFVVVDGMSPPDDCVFANTTTAITEAPMVVDQEPEAVDVAEPEKKPEADADVDAEVATDEAAEGNRLSTGASVGIVIGSLVLLAVVYYLVAVHIGGTSKKNEAKKDETKKEEELQESPAV